MNRMYGFEGECRHKYNERVFKLFSESFSALPLATLIGSKFFVLHGGLFSDDDISLDDVRKLNRHKQRQPGQSGLMMEMLWTDPQPQNGRGPSKRGVGLQFGPDVTKRFCEKNGLEAIIRSHEVRMEGYEVEHDGRCITGMGFQQSADPLGTNFYSQSSLHPSTVTAPRTRVLSSTLARNTSSNTLNSMLCRIHRSSPWPTHNKDLGA
ncbi:Metallo-dependent phosphatase [Aulographum hederae CBS 113979]|uniref:Metallo-dependent phosphatase n=1 Tax=Aulographum hederae CBS 113979 TaxID=1176131 RepID=A0A6G1HAG8_9PEZI|nr:Metallo-dependent phosphatase [Aulographum hederae CBS 113979]